MTGDWLWLVVMLTAIFVGDFAWYRSGKARGRQWAHDKNLRWLAELRKRATEGQELRPSDVLHLWGREWHPEAASEAIEKEWEKHVAHRETAK